MSVVGSFFLKGKPVKIVFKNEEYKFLKVFIEFEHFRGVCREFYQNLKKLEDKMDIKVDILETLLYDAIIITSKSLCDFKKLSEDSPTAEAIAVDAFRRLIKELSEVAGVADYHRIDEGPFMKVNSI